MSFVLADILDKIPTKKSERWKYTNLPARLKKLELQPVRLGWADNIEPLHGNPPGHDQYKDSQLWDLNNQYSEDYKVLSGDGEVTIDAKDSGLYSPRIRIHLQKGQEATVFEHQKGEGAYWKNQVCEITLEEGAILNHIRFQNESLNGTFTNFTSIDIARDAQYRGFTLTTGEGLSRNQIHAELKGRGADCTINGINLLSGKQHADTTITIEHQAPHCTSNQFFRSVLTDNAHGVFQGKVHVHQIAQKTDGYQLCNTLLLSPLAHMDAKPELEIYADDVKCSHGATCGKLDEEPLFYMRARGLDETAARRLLIEAFLAEVTQKVGGEDIQADIQNIITEWLDNHC